MKVVAHLAKEYRLSFSEITAYLFRIGVEKPSLNTRIDSLLEKQIVEYCSLTPSPKAERKPNYKVEHPELITVFTENAFSHPVQKISHLDWNLISSHFTDEQAKLICSKMSNSRIRYFSSLFLTDTPEIDKSALKYQIHFLANKALKFYGGQILTFVYNLKTLLSGTRNVEVYRMKSNTVSDFDTNFSKLSIQSYGLENSFTITFTRAYERPDRSYPALTITNHRTNKTTQISVNGQLINDFENCIPEIALFKQKLADGFLLYSGYDDDYCDICNRRLTDSISIKYGRGPCCRRDYGIP